MTGPTHLETKLGPVGVVESGRDEVGSFSMIALVVLGVGVIALIVVTIILATIVRRQRRESSGFVTFLEGNTRDEEAREDPGVNENGWKETSITTPPLGYRA